MRVEILTPAECFEIFGDRVHYVSGKSGEIAFGRPNFQAPGLTYLPGMQALLGGKIFSVKEAYLNGYSGQWHFHLDTSIDYTVADWMVKNFYLDEGEFMGGVWLGRELDEGHSIYR